MNNYFRDLSCRQNQPITQAEIHLFENAKRYNDKEIKECNKIMNEKKRLDTTQKNSITTDKIKERKQLNLDGDPTEKQRIKRLSRCEEELDDLRIKLENTEEELENIKNLNFREIIDGNEIEKRFEEKFIQRFFVYKKKLIILDDNSNLLKIKYKSDLFDEFIQEFGKLYDWLDFRSTYLKFNDNDGKEYMIDKTEVKNIITFFDKINKIKKDDEE